MSAGRKREKPDTTQAIQKKLADSAPINKALLSNAIFSSNCGTKFIIANPIQINTKRAFTMIKRFISCCITHSLMIHARFISARPLLLSLFILPDQPDNMRTREIHFFSIELRLPANQGNAQFHQISKAFIYRHLRLKKLNQRISNLYRLGRKKESIIKRRFNVIDTQSLQAMKLH